jgi:UDP-glucose 4-epimerase
MRVLITGGAGFIGSHITDLLIKQGYEITIIDNLSTGKIENLNPRVRFYKEDLRNFQKIKEIFQNSNPEIVYHLAAQIDVRKSVENPIEDAEINILAALNLLELSKKYKVKHFIFSSTGGAIYGDTKIIPTPEEHKEFPISPYGCAKLTIEKYLNYYKQVYNLKYTILRYSNVYGPRQNSKGEAGVISIFFENLFNNKNPKIFGGIQTRDFVYVEDVARANLLALNDEKSNTYNIGTGIETDIIGIFSKMNKYFKNKFSPEYYEMKKGEQKRSCLSCEKIKNSLKWQPQTNLDDGLDKTYSWFIKNRPNN